MGGARLEALKGCNAMWQAIWRVMRALVFGRSARAGATDPAAPRNRILVRAPARAGRSDERPTMNAAYDKLMQHLDSQNIGYWSRSEDCSIATDFRGDVGVYRVCAQVDADDHLFQVLGWSPVRVPVGSRPAIAEALVRINCGLRVGKFEMHYDEGEIRFQAAQILPDDNLESATIDRLMNTTVAMLDTYLPAILSVIYGNELPKDAVRHAEPGRFGIDGNDGEPQEAHD
jgi:hypothetical protein